MSTQSEVVVAVTTKATGQYQKYIKPRLQNDPEFRAHYIKTHVDKYVRRYKTDPEFKRIADEKAKVAMRNKYHEDPEYRARKIEYARMYREKKRALKSSSIESD